MGALDGFKLNGKIALVTGSSRGIGRAIALGLAECGADIAVHCVGSVEAAHEVARKAKSLGVRSEVFQADLSDATAPQYLFNEIKTCLGEPDILVLNASVQIRSAWHEIPRDEAQLQIQTNLLSSLELIRICQPAMASKKWGRILTIGSVQEIKPHPQMAIYAATKAAQTNLVRNLAAQLAGEGISINNLAPGVILTDRNTQALSNADYAERVRAKIPAGFFGEAEDCVGAALLLCSDAGRYITGTSFLVDGGFSL